MHDVSLRNKIGMHHNCVCSLAKAAWSVRHNLYFSCTVCLLQAALLYFCHSSSESESEQLRQTDLRHTQITITTDVNGAWRNNSRDTPGQDSHPCYIYCSRHYQLN